MTEKEIFKGKIGRTIDNSEPWWPEPIYIYRCTYFGLVMIFGSFVFSSVCTFFQIFPFLDRIFFIKKYRFTYKIGIRI